MKIGIVPKILLDTNVILETFLGKEPTASRVRKWIEDGTVAISAVSVGEITSKASKDETEKLELLISKFGVLPVDGVIAKIAGNYRKEFFRKEKKVFLLDCFLAATAKLYNFKLATRNVKDFPMTDIEVINPSV